MNKQLDKSTVWLLFMFLGWSYGSFGKIAKQLAFYATFGGFGLWTLYILFTLNGKIERWNNGL